MYLDMLFPIFAYLYLDLILSGREQDANVFYHKFAVDSSLKTVDTNIFLEELARISNKTDLSQSPKV